jgi:hypothetical protein
VDSMDYRYCILSGRDLDVVMSLVEEM